MQACRSGSLRGVWLCKFCQHNVDLKHLETTYGPKQMWKEGKNSTLHTLSNGKSSLKDRGEKREFGWYECTFEFLDLCSCREKQLKNQCHRLFSSREPTLLVGQLLRPTVQFYSRFFCYYIQVTRICYGKWVTYQRPAFCGTSTRFFFLFWLTE